MADRERAFVHLRARSVYSLLEGALQVKALVKLAGAEAMPALGLADNGNMFGALEFSEAAARAGIQPVIGTVIALQMDAVAETPQRGEPVDLRLPKVALYAMSPAGYENLMALSSWSYLEGAPQSPRGEAFITFDRLKVHADGLIALTGGAGGPLERLVLDGKPEEAAPLARRLQEVFRDRLYIELQRYGRPDEGMVEDVLLDCACDLGIGVVATNEAYFGARDDFEAHDALMAIAQSTVISDDSRFRLTPEHYFKTGKEMAALFADLPEALESTVEIARRCHDRPVTRAPILPRFAGHGTDEDAALATMAEEGLEARFREGIEASQDEWGAYRERLAHELAIIKRMQYSGYFLIVADFIQWAKSRDIPVGPGRGSGAGSLVAYALQITDLDPIRFGLLFERFLNPERVSMPDFDIDFCPERRDEVIRYVQDKYGHDQVAQIITFGTLQARAVMRDVGRVLQISYGRVDGLCKLVPHNPTNPVTLAEAIGSEAELQAERDKDPAVARLLEFAVKLEGLYRHPSTHAAGIVIGDRPLQELVPLFRDPRSDMPVTQFNMKWVENAGLVKFDFLGLKTLTVIEKTVELLKERGVDVDINTLPLDDVKTYELLSAADTVGVFQLESAGMRDALKRIQPDRFEDIIALVALYRPGPMENIPTYGARKHGQEQPEYLHPKLEPILMETFGVIIYQEQVMEIARTLSGYSLGEADLLRRAMGKKIREEMDKQRVRFVDGAVEGDIEKARAEHIFDLVARFADYGFNKSHAACYALVAYHTAYLKANYPVEFLAASMTLDMGNTDKLAEFFRDAARMGVKIAPPDVNRSRAGFSVSGGEVVYALAALKNVGRSAAEAVVAARNGDSYSGLQDFAGRIDAGIINRRSLESLAAAGAFDSLESDRAKVFESAETLLASAARASQSRSNGQSELFAGGGAPVVALARDTESWGMVERLNREYNAVGFFLSGHPLDEYGTLLKKKRLKTLAELEADVKRGAAGGRVAGVVTSRQDKRGRNGNRYAIIQLSDTTSQMELFIFSDRLAEAGAHLSPGSMIIAQIEAEMRRGEVRATLSSCTPLDPSASAVGCDYRLFLDSAAALDRIARHLGEEGESEVEVVVTLPSPLRDVIIRLPERYQVTPAVVGAWKMVEGVRAVHER